MYIFPNTDSVLLIFLIWLVVLFALFFANEITRRYKMASIIAFVILPLGLTVLWKTVLADVTYTDWFHMIKVYSALAGTIGFFLIRHLEKKDPVTGKVTWRLRDYKVVLIFPPLILAVNILQAVARDLQIGLNYWNVHSGPIMGEVVGVMGGPWNYMNAAAGLINIITITGFFGIVIRKKTKKDTSRDMLWPDMLWFWIIAYCIWNFAYTYNALPTHSFYAGLALLVAPTLCAFTIGKGAWLQHRAQTLALWCMFAQTFPAFQDEGTFVVESTYNFLTYNLVSGAALAANVGVLAYMLYRIIRSKHNPYTQELYTNLESHKTVTAFAE